MRIKREELEQSKDFKRFVGGGKVILARDIFAKLPVNYSTWLVVVLPDEHNPKPGDRYNLLRFFPMGNNGDNIVCSVDKQGVEMLEILDEVMNQLIEGKK